MADPRGRPSSLLKVSSRKEEGKCKKNRPGGAGRLAESDSRARREPCEGYFLGGYRSGKSTALPWAARSSGITFQLPIGATVTAPACFSNQARR